MSIFLSGYVTVVHFELSAFNYTFIPKLFKRKKFQIN